MCHRIPHTNHHRGNPSSSPTSPHSRPSSSRRDKRAHGHTKRRSRRPTGPSMTPVRHRHSSSHKHNNNPSSSLTSLRHNSKQANHLNRTHRGSARIVEPHSHLELTEDQLAGIAGRRTRLRSSPSHPFLFRVLSPVPTFFRCS